MPVRDVTYCETSGIEDLLPTPWQPLGALEVCPPPGTRYQAWALQMSQPHPGSCTQSQLLVACLSCCVLRRKVPSRFNGWSRVDHGPPPTPLPSPISQLGPHSPLALPPAQRQQLEGLSIWKRTEESQTCWDPKRGQVCSLLPN